MNYITVINIIVLLIAVTVMVYTLVALKGLPEARNHRPLAPVAALALAYTLLKLQTILGYPELLPEVREIAWLLWHGAVLIELGYLVWLHSKCRERCPLPEGLHRPG